MWYYSQNNQQMGPVPEDQLKSMLRGSSLPATTLVWKEGMSDWKPASEILALSVALPVVTPTVYQAPSNNPYATPQSQPVRSYAAPQPMVSPVNGGGVLAFAICTTILCCPAFGIVGIVYAAQINSKLGAGDVLGAVESARKSKMWSWISVGSIGVIFVIALIGGMLEEINR
jgi:hypothetical protein